MDQVAQGPHRARRRPGRADPRLGTRAQPEAAGPGRRADHPACRCARRLGQRRVRHPDHGLAAGGRRRHRLPALGHFGRRPGGVNRQAPDPSSAADRGSHAAAVANRFAKGP